MILSAILLSMLMIRLYSNCDQACDLWQQLKLASELKSDLGDTWTAPEIGLLILK